MKMTHLGLLLPMENLMDKVDSAHQTKFLPMYRKYQQEAIEETSYEAFECRKQGYF